MSLTWLRHKLGILTDDEVDDVVERQPSVRAARVQLGRADKILEELEKLEGAKKPKPRPRRRPVT